jgi:hypothetical protein
MGERHSIGRIGRIGRLGRVGVVVLVACGGVVALPMIAYGCSSSSSNDTSQDASQDASQETPPAPACATQHHAVYQSYCPGYESLAQLTGDCALQCILMTDHEPPNCVQDCLKQKTGGAIDDTCLQCHSDLVACARKYCVAPCVAGPLDLHCLDCMCGGNFPAQMNCYVPFNACSGLGITYCEAREAGTFDGFPPPEDGGPCEGGDDADAGTDAKDAAASDG